MIGVLRTALSFPDSSGMVPDHHEHESYLEFGPVKFGKFLQIVLHAAAHPRLVVDPVPFYQPRLHLLNFLRLSVRNLVAQGEKFLVDNAVQSQSAHHYCHGVVVNHALHEADLELGSLAAGGWAIGL